MSTSSARFIIWRVSTTWRRSSAARRRGASKPPRRGVTRQDDLIGGFMDSTGDREAILKQVTDWTDAGKRVALATVVTTWGSSPRPVGSKLAVDADGNFVGSVSGGCIE